MNFRSIEKLKLDLSKLHNKKTLILLWINEVWKSNILY